MEAKTKRGPFSKENQEIGGLLVSVLKDLPVEALSAMGEAAVKATLEKDGFSEEQKTAAVKVANQLLKIRNS